MDKFNLDDMTKGWFVGDFDPTSFSTKECEVACKRYKSGDYENKHLHKVATEITLIAEGRVLMNGREYEKDDIILIKPNESTDFEALEDTTIFVVKVPSVKGDKYMI